MGLFDVFKKKRIGNKRSYLSNFQTVPMDCTEKIVIRYAYSPDHAGECSFGYSLILNNGEWFFETTRLRAVGSVEITYEYDRLDKNFLKGNIYRNLNDYVLSWDVPITQENIAEKEKLEQLKNQSN